MSEFDDLIRDMERRLAALASHVDLTDEKIRSDLRSLQDDVRRLKENEEDYVSDDRFRPVERLVLGATGLLLIAVVTALVSLVVRGG